MFKNYKNWLIFKPFIDIYNSFFNGNGGFSYRKLAGIYALYVARDLGLSIVDDNVKQNVIFYWQTFASVCIGLITIPQLITFLVTKSKEKSDEKPSN